MQEINLPSNSMMLSKDFLFGVATSSFQIEGDRNGRLDCIWDTFCAQENTIEDGTNGDEACKHIELWKQDVALIDNLGVDAYRLSISWPRVMNQDGTVNEIGIRFYINLVDELKRRGMKVFVTLYHWDLPQYLEDQGGWLNRDTAYAFAQYAEVVANALGEKVHAYATLNEPFCSAYLGYEVGIHAPGITGVDNGRKAAHHLLLAHGLALKVLNKYCPNSQNGIVLNFSTCHGATDSQADKRAAQLADDYHNQWYLTPIVEGKYPEVIDRLDDADKPDIHEGDMAIISQPIDYLGINYYTRTVYEGTDNDWFEVVPPTTTELTAMGWEITPDAFTELLVDLHQRYTLPPIYITENGAAMDDKLVNGEVNDDDRTAYFHTHLNAVNSAIEKGVDIRGYFAWSLMDNFEWALGYKKRFGIVYVDYKTQKRTLKQSALAYSKLVKSRINGYISGIK
ncbi:GH1 family beta-glucosidase [Alteromonas sp.]|uniref:GH1 family beta-glucosidase n=1 Tax=Alteromonas sp. TaxID=232 RepID=UPI00257A9478|nr:GH1 family beta-glucosidase [Alteromonas sp.]NQY18384.1 beta-glucosidase [Alteromonas sp.]